MESSGRWVLLFFFKHSSFANNCTSGECVEEGTSSGMYVVVKVSGRGERGRGELEGGALWRLREFHVLLLGHESAQLL